jgi:hypothetical protein
LVDDGRLCLRFRSGRRGLRTTGVQRREGNQKDDSED